MPCSSGRPVCEDELHQVGHYVRFVTVAASTATASAATVRVDDMAGGMVAVAAASSIATRMAVFGSVDDVTYRKLYGSDGAAAEVVLNTAADNTYTLPDAVYGLQYVRLVPDADPGTAASVTVTVKS